MTTQPAVVPPTETVADLLSGAAASARSFPTYPVMYNGRLVGVASVREAEAVPAEARQSRTVSDVMVPLPGVPTVCPAWSWRSPPRRSSARRRGY